MSQARIPDDLQKWIDARKRHHLSHAHVQMARELGMKPKSLGKLDNHRQEPWKLPLPRFIEELYLKRFGKERPSAVFSIEEHALHQQQKKAAKREARNLRRETAASAAATAGNDPGADAEQPPDAGFSAAPHRIENHGMNMDYDQEPPFPVAAISRDAARDSRVVRGLDGAVAARTSPVVSRTGSKGGRPGPRFRAEREEAMVGRDARPAGL